MSLKFKRKAAAVILCLILVTSLSACSSNASDKNASDGKTAVSGSSQQSTASPAFEMYKKVTLGMTKDQVNAALGLAPVAETNPNALPGSFNYKEQDGKYGVYVVYNDKNILYSKTVIYDSPIVLAPLTQKAVTEEQANSITDGMTNADVVKILGGEGIECSATAILGDMNKVGVIKRWGNKDGSFIQVVFTSAGKANNAMFFSAS